MFMEGALLRLALRQLPVVVLRVTMHVDLRIFCLNCLAASGGIDTRKNRAKRNAVVGVTFGSLMVQRDQWDTYVGPKKDFF